MSSYEQALGELRRIEEKNKQILEEEPAKLSAAAAAALNKRPGETSGGGEPEAKRPKTDDAGTTALQARKRIKKQLKTISRRDLEELVAAKMLEAVANRTEIGQLRRQVDTFAATIETWKSRAAALTKQCSDLGTVMKKYVLDSRAAKGNRSVVPVRITRSVGLQVLPPERRSQPRVTGPSAGGRGRGGAGGLRGGAMAGGPTQQRPAVPAAAAVLNVAVSPAASRQASSSGRGGISLSPRPSVVTSPGQVVVAMAAPRPPSVIVPSPAPPSAPVQPATSRPVVAAAAAATKSQATPEVVDLDLSDDETDPAPNKNILSQSASRVALPLTTLHNSSVGPRPGVVQAASRVYTVRPANSVGHIRQPAAASQMQQRATAVPRPTLYRLTHPAPLPPIPNSQPMNPGWRMIPPKPSLKIQRVDQGIVLSWNMVMNLRDYDMVAAYHLFAYQEQPGLGRVDSSLWKKVGDVKALPLPMACTLTQFSQGNKYHFAVRASDTHGRFGPFSDPASIVLN